MEDEKKQTNKRMCETTKVYSVCMWGKGEETAVFFGHASRKCRKNMGKQYVRVCVCHAVPVRLLRCGHVFSLQCFLSLTGGGLIVSCVECVAFFCLAGFVVLKISKGKTMNLRETPMEAFISYALPYVLSM
jgi:hypothetical protein